MITGAAGLGKTQLATVFARLLLCDTPVDGVACEACSGCNLGGNHPDRIEVVPEEGKATISVDQVRSLAGALALKSHQGQRKVALLYPAEAMTHNAANSLLKTLEEPPGKSVLILVSDKPSKLPATIMSRCQRLSVAKPNHQEALTWLASREPDYDWELALGFTDGAPLKALEWRQEGRVELGVSLLKDLAKIIQGEMSPSQSAPRWEKAGPWSLACLHLWVQESIKLKSGVSESDLFLKALSLNLHELTKNIKLRDIFKYMDELTLAIGGFEGPANKSLWLESLLIPWQHSLEQSTG